MTVKFKFDYVLDLHNRQSYITAIERDGVEEEMAYKRSLVQINKGDIKSITKTKDGAATIIRKSINPPLTTIEDYDEILDTIKKANLAVDTMQQEKVYIFEDFEVDDDELTVTESWSAIREEEIVL
jgi:uncharacterized protein YqgV (UPF0045/DUF77 family)